MESLRKSLIVVAALGIAVLGVNLQATSAHKGSISLANLNALKITSNEIECPSPYDVPNAELKMTTTEHDVLCTSDGYLFFSGQAYTGDFVEGKLYYFLVKEYACTDNDKQSCCNVDSQRVEIVTPEN